MITAAQLPVIAIPMGDPAGIGPEIIIRSLNNSALYSVCRPLVFGDADTLRQTALSLHLTPQINVFADAQSCNFVAGEISIIQASHSSLQNLKHGIVSAEGGRCAYDCIVKATEAALAGQVDGMATTPINKESIKAANIDFIGHTEMLAALTATPAPLTMFQVKNLRVFFFSRHLSLRQACEAINKADLITCLKQCDRALQSLQESKRHIAVAGLNPHCGEHGLFGNEEGLQIEPAILAAQQLGLQVSGPIAADSVFHQALQGKFDAVLSLYHDQGHIATKTYDFERTIAVTLGLPFIRTSVDHGTAFDIAGKGLASPVSMIEAIKLAAAYSVYYKPAAPVAT